MEKSKAAFRHSIIRYKEGEDYRFFSNSSKGDLFFVDSTGQFTSSFAAVAPDSIGGMVFRYNRVSIPFTRDGELLYLRMPHFLHTLKIPEFVHDSIEIKALGNYIFENILEVYDKSLYYYGEINHPNYIKEEVVSRVNLETGESERIFYHKGTSTVAKVSSDGEKIYLSHKYKPIVHFFGLGSNVIDSVILSPSKNRLYNKIEFKKEYFSLSDRERVKYREDIVLDYQIIEGYHFQLFGIFRDDPEGNYFKHLLTVNKDGRIAEKVLPPDFLNFDRHGNVYSLYKNSRKTYLVTTPVLDLVGWQYPPQELRVFLLSNPSFATMRILKIMLFFMK
ncbi:hypothetical protein SYJ56_22605 [Algoriphagus sp. D3-2-R+10]|uniref:hypothetical protein n=1 Tax=Algoriphagus aurantiacus TaxID=3103948 RepID=UPI002B3AE856|nr:hypothetical protein [Algoriphagus sp. D3-2-R+10]MEB2778121.1 hypothetical protein [Algoriphagus sp. D3-2-R+10]